MICKIGDEQEALSLLERFQKQGFRTPMLETPEQLRRNLLGPMFDPRDLVLGIYREERLEGLFSFVTQPEERYMELLVALSHDREDCARVLRYLGKQYPGFTLDCVFCPQQECLSHALEDFGAEFYPIQVRLRREKPVTYRHNHRVVPYGETYRAGYEAIHGKDCYWTAERIIEAPEIFRVVLALQGETVVGYVDYTCCHEENEIYDLFVRESCRGQGIGKALLAAALEDNGNKGMTLMVDEDNAAALSLCQQMGFRPLEEERSQTSRLVLGEKTAIRPIQDPGEKTRIAAAILHDLPDWFGMPEYTENYIRESSQMPFLAVFDGEKPLGFIALKQTSRYTAEVYVMGVRKDCHRTGLGRRLYEAFETYAKQQGYSFLQVKTVRTGCYPEYDRTNLFYQAMGFRELECFPTLWDKWNPCQIYVKAIGCGERPQKGEDHDSVQSNYGRQF